MSGPLAFVRPVPATFSDAVTMRPVDPPLDHTRAAQQHGAYVSALEGGGYEIVRVPVADASPDSPFIEDAAVVIGSHAAATRPGHPARRAEVPGVAEVLDGRFTVHRLQDPATLDGGDVLKVGRRVLVGLSSRTNRAAVQAIAALAEPQGYTVSGVPVLGVLHLKSGLSAIDDATVLWHRAACDRSALEGLDVIEVEGDDPEAANVVRLADGSVLVSSGHDETAAIVEQRGFDVVRVDVSEFGRADGGLTCLSIRVR